MVLRGIEFSQEVIGGFSSDFINALLSHRMLAHDLSSETLQVDTYTQGLLSHPLLGTNAHASVVKLVQPIQQEIFANPSCCDHERLWNRHESTNDLDNDSQPLQRTPDIFSGQTESAREVTSDLGRRIPGEVLHPRSQVTDIARRHDMFIQSLYELIGSLTVIVSTSTISSSEPPLAINIPDQNPPLASSNQLQSKSGSYASSQVVPFLGSARR